jgi:hypothetical protein
MAIVHLVDPHHFICVLGMVSRHLAEAFLKNSMPQGFNNTVPTALHSYEDIFRKTAFDSLP